MNFRGYELVTVLHMQRDVEKATLQIDENGADVQREGKKKKGRPDQVASDRERRRNYLLVDLGFFSFHELLL